MSILVQSRHLKASSVSETARPLRRPALSARPSLVDSTGLAISSCLSVFGLCCDNHSDCAARLTVSCLGGAGRGRPPQAAARRAGLEDVEKVLTESMVALRM
jgi:hypothetical protein